jgi:hypothetical protein
MARHCMACVYNCPLTLSLVTLSLPFSICPTVSHPPLLPTLSPSLRFSPSISPLLSFSLVLPIYFSCCHSSLFPSLPVSSLFHASPVSLSFCPFSSVSFLLCLTLCFPVFLLCSTLSASLPLPCSMSPLLTEVLSIRRLPFPLCVSVSPHLIPFVTPYLSQSWTSLLIFSPLYLIP